MIEERKKLKFIGDIGKIIQKIKVILRQANLKIMMKVIALL
jgi:hypothetical protein